MSAVCSVIHFCWPELVWYRYDTGWQQLLKQRLGLCCIVSMIRPTVLQCLSYLRRISLSSAPSVSVVTRHVRGNIHRHGWATWLVSFLALNLLTDETQPELLTTVWPYLYLTPASPTTGGVLEPNRQTSKRCATWWSPIPYSLLRDHSPASLAWLQKTHAPAMMHDVIKLHYVDHKVDSGHDHISAVLHS